MKRLVCLRLIVVYFLVISGEASIAMGSFDVGYPIDSLKLTDPIPPDMTVKRGKLPNGFTYYIKHNAEPDDRVVMYLAVKVGSVQETDDQRGLAHFLEHMNFNGTENFPKNELIDYLQQAGVRFGSDLNAHTSYTETVYKLPIPSDDPELLTNGLQVMRDWAQEAMLEDSDIDKERGVVLEEITAHKGVNNRMREQYLPMVLNQSRYAARTVIGNEESIRNFTYDALRKFHRDWYRPDLQALVVVGDIDVAAVEQRIIRLFSDLTMPENAPQRVEYGIPLLGENHYLVLTDPEMTNTVVQILIKHPDHKPLTINDLRDGVMHNLYNQMVHARFAEISRKPDPPFVGAGATIGSFFDGITAYSIFVAGKPGDLESGVKATLTEVERIKQHGFTESELARAKSNYRTSLETAYAERDKNESIHYVNDYVNEFLNETAALSDEDQYRIYTQLLESIELADINALTAEYYQHVNRDVIVMAPDTERDNLPDEQQFGRWMEGVRGATITPYDDDVPSAPLLPEEPEGGTIVDRNEVTALGMTELTLSNGMNVLLKPTDFKNDEIRFMAFSPGGTSLYADEDYFSATYAANIIAGSGLANYNRTQLSKFLSGKKVGVSPYINENNEGVIGSSGKRDLRTAFELIHLYFTAPRLDLEAFESLVERTRASLANAENSPTRVFVDSINAVLYDNNVRRINTKPAHLTLIDPQRALEIYRERFANASDFTFVFVGSFTEADVVPLIERYLASLPAVGKEEKARDLGLFPKAEGRKLVVSEGIDPKSSVQLQYFGSYRYTDEENLQLDALQGILDIRLLERLREEESSVYGVGAGASYAKVPRERYSFGIYFNTSPQHVDQLIASTLDEIGTLQSEGPDQVDVDKFVMEQKRLHELNIKDNGYWLGSISGAYLYGHDPMNILYYPKQLEAVTVESVREAANRYLIADRRYMFILLPEQSETENNTTR